MEPDKLVQESHWNNVYMILEASLPPDKVDEVAEGLKAHGEPQLWPRMLGKVITNTITLVLGWAVYTFLV